MATNLRTGKRFLRVFGGECVHPGPQHARGDGREPGRPGPHRRAGTPRPPQADWPGNRGFIFSLLPSSSTAGRAADRRGRKVNRRRTRISHRSGRERPADRAAARPENRRTAARPRARLCIGGRRPRPGRRPRFARRQPGRSIGGRLRRPWNGRCLSDWRGIGASAPKPSPFGIDVSPVSVPIDTPSITAPAWFKNHLSGVTVRRFRRPSPPCPTFTSVQGRRNLLKMLRLRISPLLPHV